MQAQLGKYKVIAFGTTAFLISFGVMILAGITVPFWFPLAAGAFEGFGIGLCFNVLQISVQEDAEKRDIPIATSLAYLLRILSQTFMLSIYGVVLSHALIKGVNETHGKISMVMLNKLNNSETAGSLPKALLPHMKKIMYDGLHNITLLALVLTITALVLNAAIQLKMKRKTSYLDVEQRKCSSE